MKQRTWEVIVSLPAGSYYVGQVTAATESEARHAALSRYHEDGERYVRRAQGDEKLAAIYSDDDFFVRPL